MTATTMTTPSFLQPPTLDKTGKLKYETFYSGSLKSKLFVHYDLLNSYLLPQNKDSEDEFKPNESFQIFMLYVFSYNAKK